MEKKLAHLLVIVCLIGQPVVLLAQDVPDKYAGREHIKIDHDKLKTMSREEQRAYMQAYKQAREEEARRAGVTPKTDGRFVPLDKPRKVEERPRLKIAGTNITYDTGTVTGTAGMASQMLGNRFDSARHATVPVLCCFPVETSGSITMITFDMMFTFFSSAVWSLYSDIMGTTAVQVTSVGVPGGVMTGLNTATVAVAYMNGPFLAGIFQFMPVSTGLGVDTGTTGGQGFHAISLNDGAPGSMLTTLTSLNAVFRVRGDVAATPVELMRFEIED